MNAVRAFIAMPIEASRELRVVCDQLRRFGRSVKTVAVEDLHLTLRFLGSTKPSQVPPVAEAIRAAAPSRFVVGLVGLNLFVTKGRPGAVWVGLENAGGAAAVVEALQVPLSQLGWPRPRRPWRAHITLGRLRGGPPSELVDLIERHRETRFGVVTIRSIVLMQSQLSIHGAAYTPLDTTALD